MWKQQCTNKWHITGRRIALSNASVQSEGEGGCMSHTPYLDKHQMCKKCRDSK